jgi:hypothetical protein
MVLKRRPLLLVTKSFFFRATMGRGKRKGKAMLVHDVNVFITEGRENLHPRSRFAQLYLVKFALHELSLPFMTLSIFVATFGDMIIF